MDITHQQIVNAAIDALERLTGIPAARFSIARSKALRTRCTAVFADVSVNEGLDILGEGRTAYVNVRLPTVDGDRLFAADEVRKYFDEIGLADVRVRAGAYIAERQALAS